MRQLLSEDLTDPPGDDIIDNEELLSPLPAQHERWALEYVLVSYDESSLKSKRENLRDNLKKWVMENGESDENGNILWVFSKPLISGSDKITGLMAQRRISEFVNEDTAFGIADKYGIRDQVINKIITEELDFDALYRLNQQGIVSDEDIDSIIEFSETFALVKIKD